MVTSKLAFAVIETTRRLWFRPTVYSVAALATVVVAVRLPAYFDFSPPIEIGPSGVETVLTVLASSMLGVVTFSLTALATALARASEGATPRAPGLLAQDGSIQNALSTFVGAFLFAVVGLLGVSGGIYTPAGRFVLFLATVVVIAIVVMTLVRWIDLIMSLGRVDDAIDHIEKATTRSFEDYAKNPTLGARPALAERSAGVPVFGSETGYIRHLDLSGLAELLEKRDAEVHFFVRAGAFIDPSRALAVVVGETDEKIAEAIRKTLTIGGGRSHLQDPRYGMVVLAEVSSRALSPGVNDPGTAIDVIGTMVRVIWGWQGIVAAAEPPEVTSPRIYIPLIDPVDVMEDGFRPLARDGADSVEVAQRLIVGLSSLTRCPDPVIAYEARRRIEEVMARARAAGIFPADLAALEATAEERLDPPFAPQQPAAAPVRAARR